MQFQQFNLTNSVFFVVYEDGYFNTCLRGGFNSKLPARLVYKSYQEIFGDLADLVRNFHDNQKIFHNSA